MNTAAEANLNGAGGMSAGSPSPGYKTTEFWVHLLVIVGLVLASVAGTLPPEYAAVAAAISQAAYSISRGLSKQGSAS